jgi:putative ABC transport system permease protein
LTVLRHYWISAWRTLMNGPFYALVNIGGLSIGLCVALLCVLIVRSDYGYDHFLRGYADTYLCVSELMPSGQPPVYNELSNQALAARLKLGYPSVRAVVRLLAERVTLGRGETTYPEEIYWADPTLFDVLGLPVLEGDAATALRQPDSIVLTREAARKYFGRESALGQWLQLDRVHRLRVTAVIADLPPGHTELQSGIFASGLTAWSKLAALDARALAVQVADGAPGTRGGSGGAARGFGINVRTYVRVVSASAIGRLQSQMPALMNSLWPNRPPGLGASIELLRLDRLHRFPGLSPGVESRMAIVSAVGLLVLLLACGNFVNLWGARLSRRVREVGVRKVAGAGPVALVLQFVGESLLQVMLASAVAVALAELLVPQINALLGTAAVLDYWHAPSLIAVIAAAALLLGIATGLYPALILAWLRPAGALRGLLSRSHAGIAVRRILTGAQFAALCGLIVAASVIYQQREYATHDALRRQTDQMLMIRSSCRPALLVELRRLPGVRGAACSGNALLDGQMFGNFRLRDGSTAAIDIVPAGPGLLALYGLEPVAGRFVSSVDPAAEQDESAASHLILTRCPAPYCSPARVGRPSTSGTLRPEPYLDLDPDGR